MAFWYPLHTFMKILISCNFLCNVLANTDQFKIFMNWIKWVFNCFIFFFHSFRTYRSDGLLLYNARSNRRQHDFIALEIINKQIVFSFSLGELYSTVHTAIHTGISDGEWHDVQINFVRQVCKARCHNKSEKPFRYPKDISERCLGFQKELFLDIKT